MAGFEVERRLIQDLEYLRLIGGGIRKVPKQITEFNTHFVLLHQQLKDVVTALHELDVRLL